MREYGLTNKRETELLERFYGLGMTPEQTKELTITEQAFLADTMLWNEANSISVTFPNLNIVYTGSLQYNKFSIWLDGKQKRKPIKYVKLK